MRNQQNKKVRNKLLFGPCSVVFCVFWRFRSFPGNPLVFAFVFYFLFCWFLAWAPSLLIILGESAGLRHRTVLGSPAPALFPEITHSPNNGMKKTWLTHGLCDCAFWLRSIGVGALVRVVRWCMLFLLIHLVYAFLNMFGVPDLLVCDPAG